MSAVSGDTDVAGAGSGAEADGDSGVDDGAPVRKRPKMSTRRMGHAHPPVDTVDRVATRGRVCAALVVSAGIAAIDVTAVEHCNQVSGVDRLQRVH